MFVLSFFQFAQKISSQKCFFKETWRKVGTLNEVIAGFDTKFVEIGSLCRAAKEMKMIVIFTLTDLNINVNVKLNEKNCEENLKNLEPRLQQSKIFTKKNVLKWVLLMLELTSMELLRNQ